MLPDFRFLAIAQPLDPDRSSSPSLPGRQTTIDLTPYVASARWGHATDPIAGNGASITLQMSRRQLKRLLPGLSTRLGPTSEPEPITNEQDAESKPQWGRLPNTGWWLLIHGYNKDGSKQGWSLTYVNNVAFGEAPGGPGAAPEIVAVQVTSESFVAFLNRSKIQLAVRDDVFGLQGFVYQLSSWGSVMSSVLGTLLAKPMGGLLVELWKSIVRTRFPDDISQQFMGEFIKVVWNEETAAEYAPLRAGQCIAVPGNQRQHLGLPAGQSIMSVVFGLFGADPRLVEIFPSFEPTIPGSSDLGEDSIGGRLCLVYRFKPVLTAPINKASIKDRYFRNSSPTACEKTAIAQTPVRTTPQGFEDAFTVPIDDVEDVSVVYSEDNRVNMVYGAHFGPVDGNNSYGLVGTPLVRTTKTVEYHGLRTATVRWPFFIPSTAVALINVGSNLLGMLRSAFKLTGLTEADALANQVQTNFASSAILDYNNAITELSWAVLGEAEQYGTATVTCRFRPWLRQGVWVTVYSNIGTLTGYVESVTHGGSVEGEDSGAAFSFSTTMSLSRVTVSPDRPEYAASIMTASLVPDSRPAQLNFSFDGTDFTGALRGVEAQALVLINYDSNELLAETRLTQDFVAGEFASKPDGRLPPREMDGENLWNNLFTLATQLQKVRDKTGKSIFIVSGYRSKEYNDTLPNASRRSQHMKAKAADIRIIGMSLQEVRDLLKQMMDDGEIIKGGLCLYPEGKGSFVHYDIRGKYTPFPPR